MNYSTKWLMGWQLVELKLLRCLFQSQTVWPNFTWESSLSCCAAISPWLFSVQSQHARVHVFMHGTMCCAWSITFEIDSAF